MADTLDQTCSKKGIQADCEWHSSISQWTLITSRIGKWSSRFKLQFNTYFYTWYIHTSIYIFIEALNYSIIQKNNIKNSKVFTSCPNHWMFLRRMFFSNLHDEVGSHIQVVNHKILWWQWRNCPWHQGGTKYSCLLECTWTQLKGYSNCALLNWPQHQIHMLVLSHLTTQPWPLISFANTIDKRHTLMP